MSNFLAPSPRGRIAVALVAATGAVVTDDFLAISLLALVGAGLLFLQGEARFLLKFLCRIWLPLAVGLAIVWGVIVQATPEMIAKVSAAESGARHWSFEIRSDGALAGFRYAALISLRLAALAALFQAAFLTLRGLRLAAFLTRLGLSPSAVAGIVSIFQLWPEFSRRTDQVVAARCARGLMTDRRFLTRVQQLPFAFRTLFFSTLGAALDRSVRWEEEGLPDRLVQAAETRPREGSDAGTTIWLVAVTAWLALAMRHFLLGRLQ